MPMLPGGRQAPAEQGAGIPRPCGRIPLLALALLLPAAPAWAAEGAHALSLAWALPFAGVLLSIALLPLLAGHLWHHHYGKIAAGWTALFLLPFAVVFGPGAAWAEFSHVLVGEYLPFITLLLALYTAGGGVLLKGNLVGTPATNTALLAVGTAIASVMGTTGASMVLIRPLLRANAGRRRKMHSFVFFIFLVSNIGGSLTPLGDPPLYLGFLKGVSFFWPTTHLLPQFLFCALLLLAVYWLIDSWAYAKEQPGAAGRVPATPVEPPPPGPEAAPAERFGIEGWVNIGLIGLVVLGVLMQGLWQPGEVTLLGQAVGIERLVAMALFLAITLASVALTPARLREENGFTWGAILEVAKLFAAIFLTMAPVLAMLKAGAAGPLGGLVALTSDAQGQPIPWVYFWLTGALSSFLDNAPTYLVFFNLAGGDAQALMGQGALTLAAISCGAVFMGANSYIGNAPNFMVKAIVEEQGVRMPSFFGYCGWALVFLIPTFILATLLFF
ncbi:sodium:proton antiporter [Pseudoroseomonas cervicalis]|uniref:sodium:proton antiporter n=1 Tax=Teichococcus cervicalis TaxID=204525 RepID=UPI002786EE79|nr:sodium:proton antiporter [Pseudoroseomonas cervicalis]MDQ1078885.1 Na+/H+ antiporter NhaD/arsenite permease-like protein [Pseudoroseomonas cervicalis]